MYNELAAQICTLPADHHSRAGQVPIERVTVRDVPKEVHITKLVTQQACALPPSNPGLTDLRCSAGLLVGKSRRSESAVRGRPCGAAPPQFSVPLTECVDGAIESRRHHRFLLLLQPLSAPEAFAVAGRRAHGSCYGPRTLFNRLNQWDCRSTARPHEPAAVGAPRRGCNRHEGVPPSRQSSTPPSLRLKSAMAHVGDGSYR